MEKYIVFGPIIIFFIFFGGLIAGFLLLILKIIRKTKADYWIGVVQDKKYFEKHKHEIGENVGRTENFYSLIVKTDSGQIRKVAVSKDMYDQCQPGDRLEKPKGKLNPIKAS